MNFRSSIFIVAIFFVAGTVFGQNNATSAKLYGRVTIGQNETVARNASVTILQLKRSVQTDENGRYEFSGIPLGKYDVAVHLDRLPDYVENVEITGDTTLDVQLLFSSINEQVTVSASGSEEAVSGAYQPVGTLTALQIAEKNPVSIGEALDNQLGVAKRSFGPGSGRPVIRGFDGDRVLVLQNGLRIGGIASQSGDEAEPIDVLSLDRIEIVKGPATLLYGSNAIGGVVNGISNNDIYQKGLSGYLTAFGGTNNWQAGGSGGLKFGFKNFLFFANGGAQKANDYNTPLGAVLNSYARDKNISGGAGWFPRKGWLSFSYGYDQRRHGIPVEPDELDLEYLKERRHAYEVKGGLRELGGFIESGDFATSYNDYRVREFEFETDENVTELESIANNKNFNYRANFNHRRFGKFSGTFGFSGFTRDYESVGEEAPAPRTKQNSFAIYGLERIDFEHIGFQFGGRVEQNGYTPEGGLRKRNFVGFSGSLGTRISLWTGGVFVANYQHSFRAPALEELYNHGPHPGILVFDIGNPDLKAEQGDGIDLSLRHNTDRLRLSGGFYFYNFKNYVFPAFTGEIDDESNLRVVEYLQGNSRYAGVEASADIKLINSLWFNSKIDYVRAELTGLNKPLPRIPPLRGTVGFDWQYKNFSVRPEAIFAADQDRVYDNESPTGGYTVFNINGSYTLIARHVAHIFSVTGYNLGDRLYRNHLSFIKDIAPEIGRGVRFNYSMRF